MTAATVIQLDQEGPASILRIEGDITSASEPGLYYNPHSLGCNSIRAQSEGYC